MKNRFQPKPQQAATNIWSTQLPVEVQWGIYARQSTPGQLIKHVESTEMQTDDLIKWLQDRGLQDNYTLFDADLGMSGTLRIDERPALSELIRRINTGEIKAVLVYQISRLFRDLTGIQYNTFADDCKKNNCILVTAYDGMIYNFNNPIHMKMFRFLAETAAEYLQQQMGLLHEARLRKARKGYYVHLGNVPSGFIVDYDKESTNYNKIVPYIHHRNLIVDKLYQRYYALCGDFNALCREIDALPYVFPLFEEWVDKRILSQWKRRQKNDGYSLSRKGIITVMTNPANIGWWIVAGDIVSKDNHDPIISPEEQYLFWYAFERLSRYNTDGEINENRIIDKPKRFYRKCTDPTEGLLKDRITSTDGKKVHVHLKTSGFQYYAIVPDHNIYIRGLQEIRAQQIDDAFTDVFFTHLEETHDFDDYQRWINIEMEQHESLLNNLQKQIKQFDMNQDAILNEILAIRTQIAATAKTEEEKKQREQEAEPYINKLREKFTALEQPKKEVEKKLQQAQASEHYTNLRQYADFQTEVKKLARVWRKKPFSVRKEFVNLFVSRAVISCVAPHWVQLDIYWTHPQWEAERLYIMRSNGTKTLWTEEEKAILYKLYPTAHKLEVLQALKSKTWRAIVKFAGREQLSRLVQTTYPLNIYISWEDVLFMQAHHIPLDATPEQPICIPLSIQEVEDNVYEEERAAGSTNSGLHIQVIEKGIDYNELETYPNCGDESPERLLP